ncbi:DNA polymerase III subunit gamma/tau, partial [Amycolatopsis alba DSM 44262]
VDALAADDASAVFTTVENLAEAGHDPRRFATDLLDRLRDLVMLRSVPDAGERGLVSAPDDELKKMKEQAGKLEPATLSRYADIVHNGLLEMRGATSPRLVLELLTARMLLPSVAEGTDALLARLERLERRAASAPAPAAVQAVPVAQAAQAAPVAQAAPPAPVAPSGEPVREFQRPSQRAAAPAQPPAPAPQAAPAPQPVSRPTAQPVAQPVARPEPVAERPAAPAPPPPLAGATDR